MTERPAAELWLRQEVDDLLDVGPVGVYELLWTLNGSTYTLTADQARDVARRVAHELVESGAARLYRMRWPRAEPRTAPLPVAMLDDDQNWEFTDDGGYMAMMAA
jgi:hypothetical protein